MSVFEVSEVEIAAQNGGALVGGYIDSPKPGDRSNGYSIGVVGWAVSRDSPAASIEFLHEGTVVHRAAIDRSRPDIGKAFPENSCSPTSGFASSFSLLKLPREFDLELRVALENRQSATLGRIRGRRKSLTPPSRSRLQPLLITTLGRSGSTWLTALLGQHSAILSYRPYQYEPRAATYWTHVLLALAEPVSYLQTLRTELNGTHWWLGDQRRSPLPPVEDPEVLQWLAGEHVESVSQFVQERLDAFYRRIATVQNRPAAAFFAEKIWPDPFLPDVILELYPEGREIFLVRDFRDMVCSILSFNRKKGFDSFGRERVGSDEEFVREQRHSALQMLKSWKKRSSRSHLVRYEDLILEPEETLAAALAYLGVDSNRAIVCETLQRAGERLDPKTQKRHQTSSGPAESIGRWRSELTESMKQACSEAFDDILEQFGYETCAAAFPACEQGGR